MADFVHVKSVLTSYISNCVINILNRKWTHQNVLSNLLAPVSYLQHIVLRPM